MVFPPFPPTPPNPRCLRLGRDSGQSGGTATAGKFPGRGRPAYGRRASWRDTKGSASSRVFSSRHRTKPAVTIACHQLIHPGGRSVDRGPPQHAHKRAPPFQEGEHHEEGLQPPDNMAIPSHQVGHIRSTQCRRPPQKPGGFGTLKRDIPDLLARTGRPTLHDGTGGDAEPALGVKNERGPILVGRDSHRSGKYRKPGGLLQSRLPGSAIRLAFPPADR